MSPQAMAIVALVLVAAVIYALIPKAQFVLRLQGGRVEIRKGKVPRRFILECQTFLETSRTDTGTIRGFRRDRGIALRFSKGFSDSERQRLRNLWTATAGR